MGNQVQPQIPPSSDEIDLGQLFKMIGNGFNKLFNSFLKFFPYLKKNFVRLATLAVIGLAIGFSLNLVISKKLKTEVIVKPNLESKSYLYDVVDEIEANIKAKEPVFFRNIGIDIEHLDGSVTDGGLNP